MEIQATDVAQLQEHETVAEPVGVPAEGTAGALAGAAQATAPQQLSDDQRRILGLLERYAASKGLRYFPTTPALAAAFLSEQSDEDLLKTVDAIFQAHDRLGLANPCCTTACALVLNRKPCTEWPSGYNKQDRIVYASLPEEMRVIIKRREDERSTELRRQQNRVSDELKRLRGGDRATTPPWAKKETTNEPQ